GLYGAAVSVRGEARRGPWATPPPPPPDPEVARILPYLAGGVTTWAVGMLTLSMHGLVPTYALLGLGTVGLSLAGPHAPAWARRFDFALALKGLFLTIAFVVTMHVFVRVIMR